MYMKNNTLSFEGIIPYDFDLLVDRFNSMSYDEAIFEYVRILNTLSRLSCAYDDGLIPFDDYGGLLGSWQLARDFLAGYFATFCLSESGYYQDVSGFYQYSAPPMLLH